jgi:hypothetical protein
MSICRIGSWPVETSKLSEILVFLRTLEDGRF